MKISRNKVSEKGTDGVSKMDEFLEKFQRRGGVHSGRGGHIIKNVKLRIKPKKLRPIAQNSGHVAKRPKVSTEILLS